MVTLVMLLSVVSSLTATAVSLAALFLSDWLIHKEPVSGEDLTGTAILSFVPSLLSCILLYAPGLRLMQKRSTSAIHLVLASTLVFNIPAFALLAYYTVAGGFFGGGEV
jgi:hypothetical protein